MKSAGTATVMLCMLRSDLVQDDDPKSRTRLQELNRAMDAVIDGKLEPLEDDGPDHVVREFDCSGARPRELGRSRG